MLERGSERWEIVPKHPLLKWLFGTFEIVDRRTPVLASDMEQYMTLYLLEAEEKAKRVEVGYAGHD